MINMFSLYLALTGNHMNEDREITTDRSQGRRQRAQSWGGHSLFRAGGRFQTDGTYDDAVFPQDEQEM